MKDIKKYESSEPLDAGEWLRKRQIKDSRLWEVYSEKNDPGYSGGEILLSQVLSDFAQASITAKEKEWEREKAELVAALKMDADIFHSLGSQPATKDEHLQRKRKGEMLNREVWLSKIIKKHTNE